ncbi:MAG: hypothetical protein ABR600_09430 [Actinomycetota bacterium]
MKSKIAALAACSLVVALAVAATGAGSAAACPPGFHPAAQDTARERTLADLAPPAAAQTRTARAAGVCVNDRHPESFDEIEAMSGQRAAMSSGERPGSYAAALRQARALGAKRSSIAGTGGEWSPYGRGPLIADDPRFVSVNGEGLDQLSGRVDSLDYDGKGHRLFATIGTGGVWVSTDLGKHWRSIGDRLPSQINGAVGWTNAGGGTVIVVGGEPLSGGDTYTGAGAFWSKDLGKHWRRAKGVPTGAMGYQVAISPRKTNVVYVATSQGLYRSRDAGRHFANVRLPTGPCAGKVGFGQCEFANFVTDVVVKVPGGTTHAHGGGVLAAVGYRAGGATFSNGKPQANWNGLYRSQSGKPGTFKKLGLDGFAPQDHVGRTELGLATGPKQNHNFVYAVVEDSKIFNDGQTGQIDAPDDLGTGASNTVLNGIYVSKDFGKTWTQMADTNEISENPNTGSALTGAGQATLYAPGVQAWYNEWIKVDPTRQTKSGVPMRILFGLEEVWENRHTDQPQDGSSDDPQGDFHVIGPYFADKTCMLLDTGQPNCPTRDTTSRTTHPDQHDAIFVPDRKGGGVTLLVGNDGGVFQQHAKRGQDFEADRWGEGTNAGFHTLLPYDADMANDGRTWIGLQDNGSGFIDGTDQKQYMAFGGDGFYVATDPNNSDVAYTETTFADMRVTTDGGASWACMDPPEDPASGGSQFANPFEMDPTDANHLLTAGTHVWETISGPATAGTEDPVLGAACLGTKWQDVFDLTSGGNGVALMSGLAVHGDASYVGFCGPCDLLGNWDTGFQTGLATNVGGTVPPKRATPAGWHFASAAGLPNRYITDVAIDPADPNTVYVTLGGYTNRQWVPPGSYLDPNKHIGTGHVFKSTDAGEHFTDVSGNLPDAPVFAVELHGGQLVAGTQVGVFISNDTSGGAWATLGHGLPRTPISSLSWKGGDDSSNVLVTATFGRGVYVYRFA